MTEKVSEVGKSVETVASHIKNTVEMVMTGAKEAIMKVAPSVWKAVKMKVIGDAVALFVVVVGVMVGLRYVGMIERLGLVAFLIISFLALLLAASSIKRIIASDFYTLLEILKLAKWGEKK